MLKKLFPKIGIHIGRLLTMVILATPLAHDQYMSYKSGAHWTKVKS
jgi:hypothetical protein